MKRVSLSVLGVALACGLAAAGGGKIKWRDGKEYDAALAEAKRTGTPVVMYFTADW
jgi:hypothetical protein